MCPEPHPRRSGTARWEGVNDGEAWIVEIEVDCFTESEGFVVSIATVHEDEDGKQETLVAPSASQAREMAAVLVQLADSVDINNARVARKPAER